MPGPTAAASTPAVDAGPRRAAPAPRRDFWIVVAIAIALRILLVLDARDAPFWHQPLLDEQAYLDLAARLRSGTPPPHGAWYVAPGYAALLAAVFTAGGGPTAAKLVNLLAGVGTTALVWRLAIPIAGRWGAIAAALAWTLYPAALLQELLLLKTASATLLSVAALALVALPCRHRTAAWAAAGLCIGLAICFRGELLLLAVVLAASGVLAARARWPGAPRGRAPLLFLVVAAAIVAIPTVQNVRHSGDVVVVAFGGGSNFWIGNHPAADGGYIPLRPDRFDPPQEEADAVRLASRALGHPASPGETSRWWFGRGLAWWRDAPLAALALTMKKLALLAGPFELDDTYSTDLAGRWVRALRAPIGAWFLLPGALAGFWIARRRRDLWPVFAFLLGSALAIVPFFLFERFRLHVVAVATPFAALALSHAIRTARARHFGRLALGLAVTGAVGVCLGLARAPRDDVVLRVNLGEMLFQAGRYEEALREFEAVRAASPAAWRVDINIANAEAARGRTEAALAALARVLPRLEDEARRTGLPSDEEIAWCRELAGDLEMERGRPQAAALHYAAALAPAEPALRAALEAKLEAARRAGATGSEPPPRRR